MAQIPIAGASRLTLCHGLTRQRGSLHGPDGQPHADARRQPRCRQRCADRGGISLCSLGFVVSANSHRGRGPPLSRPAGYGVPGPAGR